MVMVLGLESLSLGWGKVLVLRITARSFTALFSDLTLDFVSR